MKSNSKTPSIILAILGLMIGLFASGCQDEGSQNSGGGSGTPPESSPQPTPTSTPTSTPSPSPTVTPTATPSPTPTPTYSWNYYQSPLRNAVKSWDYFSDQWAEDFEGIVRSSSSGGWIAALTDNRLFLFDHGGSNPFWIYEDENGFAPDAVEMSKDGSTIIVAEGDTLRVLSNQQNRTVFSLNSEAFSFRPLAVSQNGEVFVAVAGFDVYIGSKSQRRWKKIINLDYYLWENGIQKIALTPDGLYLAMICETRVFIINTAVGVVIREYQNPLDFVKNYDHYFVDVTPDGKYILAGGSTNLKVYQRDSNEVFYEKNFINDVRRKRYFYENSVEFSNFGKQINILYSDETNGVKLSRLEAIELPSKNVLVATDKFDFSFAVSSSQNGKYIYTNGYLDWDGRSVVYAFDRDFKQNNKPFNYFVKDDDTFFELNQIDSSSDGSRIAYSSITQMHSTVIDPGLLAEVQDEIPVYLAGQEMSIKAFITNPSIQDDIRIQAYLSVFESTQIGLALIDDLEQSADTSIAGKVLSKTIELASPSETKVYESITHVTKGSHIEQNVRFRVPSLLDDGWIAMLFDVLGLDAVYEATFGAIDRILPETLSTGIRFAVDALASGGQVAPNLGVARIVIKNARTGEAYSQDAFYFVFVAGQ